jgi:hypothetical protein
MELLYPDIPTIGIPATYVGRLPAKIPGLQFKCSAAFAGDFWFQACRRFVSENWDKHGVPTYSYHFNVKVNGIPSLIGSTHFQEVAFVFDNTEGLGYYTQPNPFGGMPKSFRALAKLMSKSWISFIHDLDPNNHGGKLRISFLCSSSPFSLHSILVLLLRRRGEVCVVGRTNAGDTVQGTPHWPAYHNGVGGYGQNFAFDANSTTLGHPEPDTFRAEGIAYINSLWPALGK